MFRQVAVADADADTGDRDRKERGESVGKGTVGQRIGDQ